MNCENRNPPIIGNLDFAYYSREFMYILYMCICFNVAGDRQMNPWGAARNTPFSTTKPSMKEILNNLHVSH